MAVTVLLLAPPLRGRLGDRSALELPAVAGESVGAFLERLFAAYPVLRQEMVDPAGRVLYEYQVWHNDELVREADLHRPVRDGDTIGLLLPMAGGGARS